MLVRRKEKYQNTFVVSKICSFQKKEISTVSAASWVQMNMLKVGALIALKTPFDSLSNESRKGTKIAVAANQKKKKKKEA